MKKTLLALLMMAAPFAFAQGPFTPVTATKVKYGTSVPPSCSAGQVFIKTTDPAGSNFYTCSGGTFTVGAGSGANPSLFTPALQFGGGYGGATCDNSTDDTTAFNALLAAANTAGGSRIFIAAGCKIAGNVVFPNDGSSPPTQKTIEIFGYGNTTNGTWGAVPTARSFLNLTNNAAVAKLDTRGIGQFIIHDLNLIDSSSDCAAFIQTTNTGLTIYDVTFSGTASSTSACNDAIVLGGTSTTIDGSATSPFQGYHTEIRNNFFDKTRRAVFGRVYANGVRVYSNTVSSSAGSNLTAAISACTNANPTVCTVTGIGLTVGTGYTLRISGATGNWTPINGNKAVVPVDGNTFSITGVNATSFGALAGSPVYLNGAAIEFNGTTGVNIVGGNSIRDNTIEVSGYAYGIKLNTGLANQVKDNNLFDGQTTLFLAYYRLENGSQFQEISHGFGVETIGSVLSTDSTSTGNSIVNPHQNQMSTWSQPWTFANTLTLNNALTGTSTQALTWLGQILSTGLVTGSGGFKSAAGQTYATTGRGDHFANADGQYTFRDSTAGANTFLHINLGGATVASPGLIAFGNALAHQTAGGTVPAFSTLKTCAAGGEGAMIPISDSTTATIGATITGSGSNHVLAYCNGTNWVVLGK